ARQRDLRKMEFLDRALTGMGCGGIYDQVGGGFHRYSTDAQWLVPHFEKMLYNQSQLTLVYLTAWRLTANPFYRRIVRQTLDYVLREMQLPDGGFYSATDADSEDQEGLYFIWTPEQLSELLQPRELELVKRLYGPTAEGNFEGANILALQSAMDSYQQDGSFQDLEAQLDPLLNKLLDARQQRIAPLRDDKLIVAWAAAMAGSLARAGWELGERGYLEAAERAVQAMLADNYPARRELRRIFLNGETSVAAQLEDYANLCEALLTLFDCTGKFPYLARAADLMDDMVVLFWNDEHGGFFLGPAHGSGPELTRSCSAADGATLSSYAVATQCLALLLERRAILEFRQHDSRLDYERLFQQSVSAASSQLDEFPPSHVTLLRALQHQSQGSILPIRYAGQGVVRISSRRATPEAGGDNDRGGRHRVVFNIASLPGFHVTGEVAENAGGAPLQLQLDDEEQHWQLGTPVMETQSVTDASGEEVFNGERIEMLVDLVAEDTEVDGLAASAGLQLAVQPCSDSVCLAPQQFRFRL
ncbi:MAG: thioredoxin domain-containing protein, partial [Pseudomonadales bacterium]|nr:thioredoxin domain-containing protein [Pseudomonadales bacterium]